MRTEQYDKLHITFDVDPDHPGLHGESLWGERVDDHRYRLANVPLASGYNLGDIVFVTQENGMIEVQGISIRGGHSKLYVLATKKGAAADARRKALADDLTELGLAVEAGSTLWMLDVGPRIDRAKVERRLADATAAGLITWEMDG